MIGNVKTLLIIAILLLLIYHLWKVNKMNKELWMYKNRLE